MNRLIRYGAMGTVFASGLVVAACANYESGSGGNIYANFPVTERLTREAKRLLCLILGKSLGILCMTRLKV